MSKNVTKQKKCETKQTVRQSENEKLWPRTLISWVKSVTYATHLKLPVYTYFWYYS